MNPEEMIRMLIEENNRLRAQLQGSPYAQQPAENPGYAAQFEEKLSRPSGMQYGPSAKTTPYIRKEQKPGPVTEKGPYKPKPGDNSPYIKPVYKRRTVGVDG